MLVLGVCQCISGILGQAQFDREQLSRVELEWIADRIGDGRPGRVSVPQDDLKLAPLPTLRPATDNLAGDHRVAIGLVSPAMQHGRSRRLPISGSDADRDLVWPPATHYSYHFQLPSDNARMAVRRVWRKNTRHTQCYLCKRNQGTFHRGKWPRLSRRLLAQWR